MCNHTQQAVQKLWNYCQALRDDGHSYGDYVEQLTYLLFLKMAHEQTQPPWRRPSPIPAGRGGGSQPIAACLGTPLGPRYGAAEGGSHRSPIAVTVPGAPLRCRTSR